MMRSWVLELSPEQAAEAVRTTATTGSPEDIADIVDQANLDLSNAQGVDRQDAIISTIFELALDGIIPPSLADNIT